MLRWQPTALRALLAVLLRHSEGEDASAAVAEVCAAATCRDGVGEQESQGEDDAGAAGGQEGDPAGERGRRPRLLLGATDAARAAALAAAMHFWRRQAVALADLAAAATDLQALPAAHAAAALVSPLAAGLTSFFGGAAAGLPPTQPALTNQAIGLMGAVLGGAARLCTTLRPSAGKLEGEVLAAWLPVWSSLAPLSCATTHSEARPHEPPYHTPCCAYPRACPIHLGTSPRSATLSLRHPSLHRPRPAPACLPGSCACAEWLHAQHDRWGLACRRRIPAALYACERLQLQLLTLVQVAALPAPPPAVEAGRAALALRLREARRGANGSRPVHSAEPSALASVGRPPPPASRRSLRSRNAFIDSELASGQYTDDSFADLEDFIVCKRGRQY